MSQLVNLTDLRIKKVSKLFADRHIVRLAGSLPKLEGWSTGGCNLTDAIWGKVASLRSLQTLDLTTYMPGFTANGILNFIENLGLGNKYLALSLMNKAQDSNVAAGVVENLSGVEQELIQEKIGQKVQGRFEWRML